MVTARTLLGLCSEMSQHPTLRALRALSIASIATVVCGCSSAPDAGSASEDVGADAPLPSEGDSAASVDDTGSLETAASSNSESASDVEDTGTAVPPDADASTLGDTSLDASLDAPLDAPKDAPVKPGDGAVSELVIMPLGDSITGEPHTYREPLYGKLTSAGCKVHFVGSQTDVYATIPEKNHEGHPGFTIGNIATSIDGWLKAAPPKIVLMMIGTNDIAWWYAGTAAEAADNHAKLLDQVLSDAPSAWVIVASIPPESSSIIEPNKVDRATLATQLNVEIKKRVQTRIDAGKKVRFADVNAALSVSDLRDGIHPTDAGYVKIADVWFKALQPIAGCLGGTP